MATIVDEIMPQDSSWHEHLLIAARWIEASLLGSIATTIAVMAVALIGLGMLGGRINLRRGATVVIGCFVLFGAPVIAGGFLHLIPAQMSVMAAAPPPPPPWPTPAPKPTAYDPYAGAVVPRAR